MSMLKEKYEVDCDVLGFEEGEVQEGQFLGRKIRYVDGGIKMEADPKQVAALIEEFGLGEANGVEIPGIKADALEDVEAMGKKEASLFRRGAAKLNYLSQDRVDIAV